MSLALLLRNTDNYTFRYNLIKAYYDIMPGIGELVNIENYLKTDRQGREIYQQVKEMLTIITGKKLDDYTELLNNRQEMMDEMNSKK